MSGSDVILAVTLNRWARDSLLVLPVGLRGLQDPGVTFNLSI